MKTMICDLHVHSKYSCDSKAELEGYCLEAINKGVNVICFTEHLDSNIIDRGYLYYKGKEFFDSFLYLKEKYKHSIKLLCGLEFSEPHLYQDSLKEYSLLPYDFILGSVHYWYQDMNPSQMVKDGIPIEICFDYYWKEVLATVKAGGFDCLGHIDFPKRYYKQLIYDKSLLYEICNELVKNNICLEINTSPLRMNMSVSMPDKDILSIYKDCGGRYVTIGSDSHFERDLGKNINYGKELVKYFNFEEIVFINRVPYPVDKL